MPAIHEMRGQEQQKLFWQELFPFVFLAFSRILMFFPRWSFDCRSSLSDSLGGWVRLKKKDRKKSFRTGVSGVSAGSRGNIPACLPLA